MPSGLCRLCERQSELQLSHVLPAFAYRWLRESSGNGHLRNSREPNKRTQDGLKFYWLCAECEELFSRNETAFAGRLFHPYLKASGQIFPYSSWLIHFCTSVSWRVLRFYRDEGHLQSWEPEAIARVESAEAVWRDVLLGKRSNPGVFQQHILPLIQGTGPRFAKRLDALRSIFINHDLPESKKVLQQMITFGESDLQTYDFFCW